MWLKMMNKKKEKGWTSCKWLRWSIWCFENKKMQSILDLFIFIQMFTNNQNSNIFSNNNNNNIFANNNNYSNNSNNNYNSNNNNSYGYNTRNSTNNSNNNNNNNNNNSNTLLRGTNEQPHQNFIKQLLGFIEDFQKSQELHCLKNILEN